MPPIIRASDLKRPQALRDMLVRRRDEIYVRVKELRHDQEGDSSPTDSMDAARSSAEVETHASLIGRAEEELQLIDEALERVERGNFGICAECGEDIPLARLNSVPFTPYCVGCEEKRDRSRRRWSEGGTIAPYDHQWAPPDEMKAPREYRVSTNTVRHVPAHEEIFPQPKHETTPAKPSRRHSK